MIVILPPLTLWSTVTPNGQLQQRNTHPGAFPNHKYNNKVVVTEAA